VKLFGNFPEAASGATAIEYAMIASIISVCIVTAVTTIGHDLATFFSSVSGYL
jgi:Flp pilus assembly pilin Flp